VAAGFPSVPLDGNYALNSLLKCCSKNSPAIHAKLLPDIGPEGNNSWRQVDVKVRKSGAQIRHRTGYYLGAAASNP